MGWFGIGRRDDESSVDRLLRNELNVHNLPEMLRFKVINRRRELQRDRLVEDGKAYRALPEECRNGHGAKEDE